MTQQGVDGTFNQAFDHKTVEPANHQGVATAALGEITFNYFNIVHCIVLYGLHDAKPDSRMNQSCE